MELKKEELIIFLKKELELECENADIASDDPEYSGSFVHGYNEGFTDGIAFVIHILMQGE